MNIIDLKKQIDLIVSTTSAERLETMFVCIPTFKVGSVGGTNVVEVTKVSKGFDWDKGKLMIFPDERLREIGKDEISDLQKKYDDIGWKEYEIRNLKSENKKLRKELGVLKGEKL